MKRVPLAKVPRQELSVNLDGAYWRITLYLSLRHVCADIEKNGVLLIRGVRCFVGIPLLPYKHLRSPNFGNFYFDSDVDWQKFNDECVLYYLDETEVRALEETVRGKNWNTVFQRIKSEADAFGRMVEENGKVQYQDVVITSQPQTVEVIIESPATISVTATGAVAYQWEWSLQESGTIWETMDQMKTPILHFPKTNERSFGYYRCIVVGLDSISVSKTAWLKQTKVPVPTIDKNLPSSADAREGDPFTFSVSSPDAYSFRWQTGPNADGPWTDIPGSDSPNYTIPSVSKAANAGRYYRAIAIGKTGSFTGSRACYLKGWVKIPTGGAEQNVIAAVGDKIVMQWFKSFVDACTKIEIYREDRPEVILASGTDGLYVIESYTPDQAGFYRARGSNPVESVVPNWRYAVTTKP